MQPHVRGRLSGARADCWRILRRSHLPALNRLKIAISGWLRLLESLLSPQLKQTQDNLTAVDTLGTQWLEAITTARLASQSAPSFPFGTLCGRGAILGANRIWTAGWICDRDYSPRASWITGDWIILGDRGFGALVDAPDFPSHCRRLNRRKPNPTSRLLCRPWLLTVDCRRAGQKTENSANYLLRAWFDFTPDSGSKDLISFRRRRNWYQ